jgi:hypothetical protein
MVPTGIKRESNASVESVGTSAGNVVAGVKRESVAESGDAGEGRVEKKRRIAPTLVSGADGAPATASGEQLPATIEEEKR